MTSPHQADWLKRMAVTAGAVTDLKYRNEFTLITSFDDESLVRFVHAITESCAGTVDVIEGKGTPSAQTIRGLYKDRIKKC